MAVPVAVSPGECQLAPSHASVEHNQHEYPRTYNDIPTCSTRSPELYSCSDLQQIHQDSNQAESVVSTSDAGQRASETLPSISAVIDSRNQQVSFPYDQLGKETNPNQHRKNSSSGSTSSSTRRKLSGEETGNSSSSRGRVDDIPEEVTELEPRPTDLDLPFLDNMAGDPSKARSIFLLATTSQRPLTSPETPNPSSRMASANTTNECSKLHRVPPSSADQNEIEADSAQYIENAVTAQPTFHGSELPSRQGLHQTIECTADIPRAPNASSTNSAGNQSAKLHRSENISSRISPRQNLNADTMLLISKSYPNVKHPASSLSREQGTAIDYLSCA